jgi:acyl dehydratase
VLVDQDRIDLFAEATGDHQWIHVDPMRAAQGPFGSTIAHGFLTLSLLPELIAERRLIDDVRMGINYGLNRVRFPARCRRAAGVRGRFKLPSSSRSTAARSCHRGHDGARRSAKPVCVAESVSRRSPA